MRPRLALLLLGIFSSALVTSCGGGGGDSGGGPQTLVLTCTASLSGFIFEGGTTHAGGEAHVGVGDNVANQGLRHFRSFDFSAVPLGARILSAVYEDEVMEPYGTPFVDLGDLIATLTEIGTELEGTDYDGPMFAAVLGVLATTRAEGVRRSDWSSILQTMLDGGGRRVDAMLRFEDHSDDDGAGDGVWLRRFLGSDTPPTLTIVYE